MPFISITVPVLIVEESIASLKVTVTVVLVATFDDPAAGLMLVIVGGVVSAVGVSAYIDPIVVPLVVLVGNRSVP